MQYPGMTTYIVVFSYKLCNEAGATMRLFDIICYCSHFRFELDATSTVMSLKLLIALFLHIKYIDSTTVMMTYHVIARFSNCVIETVQCNNKVCSLIPDDMYGIAAAKKRFVDITCYCTRNDTDD